MASEQPDDASPQIRALRQCSAALVVALSAADTLIPWLLFAKDLIGQDTIDYCQLDSIIQSTKSSKIVNALIKTVSASQHLFETLVSVLSESGNETLMSVGEKLKQTYETPCHSHSFHTHRHHPPITSHPHHLPSIPYPHHPPITPHHHHPPITPHSHHPPSTPLQQQSPICQYANHLREVYKRSELSNPACYKWMRSPGEKFKFINLAVISKKQIGKEEADKIKKETIQGHIDLILKKKAPIAIENILQVEQGQSLTCVLIEGAPGVGKSTLSWEICRRWGRGGLFQEYSIVLLVTLRDERVQRATCVVDLFYHSDKKLQEEVVREIGKTNGKGILILLEGLDELPKYLLTNYSIFTDLLSGAIFPEATVLVTSRPSATDKLWKKWWQQKSCHIEILGFTEDNIDEYTKSVLPDHQFLGFNNYLSIHPHIKSMMYVPLHCAITIAVYLQCQQCNRSPPKTLTGLYTCLAQTILIQYLEDHPDYNDSDCKFNSFSELPSPVYANFKSLCSLAFYGVKKQQLVFHNLSMPQSLDTPQQFEHLGFMDAVPEQCLLFQQLANYSYNFLHLSIQEYLAAYHVSLMSHQKQEQLLLRVRYGDHRFNMIRFLAGITQFKHLNKELVKEVIGIKSRSSEIEIDILDQALEFLYECQDVSILESDSKYSYYIEVQSTDSIHHLTTLGYSIARSSSKWNVIFLGRNNTGIEAMCYNLKENPQPTYSIETIEFEDCSPEFTHQVLQHLPNNALKKITKLSLHHDHPFCDEEYKCEDEDEQDYNQPIPPCLPVLIPRMEKLNTLTLENVLHTSLMKLTPALTRVTTLRKLLISSSKDTHTMRFLAEFVSGGTIVSSNYASDFLDQLLPALPQQNITCIESLTIDYVREYGYFDGKDHHQCQLPLCLPGLISKMERLKSLTLENVLDTSLAGLIPILPKVITLRNILISGGKNTFEMQLSAEYLSSACGTIESVNYASDFLDQLLPALPQQSTVCIESLMLQYMREYVQSDEYQYPSLPSCLPDVISKMERLNTLTLKNVLETSLTELLPVLSRITTLRNLLISDEKNTFKMKLPFEHISIGSNYASNFLDQLLLALPQQSTRCVTSLTIDNGRDGYNKYHQCQHPPLPSCLPDVISKMEILETLTLEDVLDTSLTELIPALSRIPTLKNVQLPKVTSEGIALLCQWLPTCQLEKLTLIENVKTRATTKITLIFCSNSIEAIMCQYSIPEFIDRFLAQIPQQSTKQTKMLKICNEIYHNQQLPSCLPELIHRMELLDTLTLNGVIGMSLTEFLPALSRVSALRNLHISESDRRSKFEMIFPAEDLSTGTIDSVNCTQEFLEKLLPALPQQRIACIKSLTINYERWYNVDGQCGAQPLPSCILELIPKMENLQSLKLLTALDATLKALIPLLCTVPITRSFSLNITLGESKRQFNAESCTYNTTENICTCTCTSQEIFDALLQFLPQQHLEHIQTLEVAYYTSKSLPLCLPKLILKMERLNTLKLVNVLDTSLTELIPALSRVPALRNLRLLVDRYSATLHRLHPISFPWAASAIRITFCNTFYVAIECQNCKTEFLNQILSQIPQKSTTHIKKLQIVNDSLPNQSLPSCLPELLSRMGRLNTLILQNLLGTSLAELIPVLPGLSTLNKLVISDDKSNIEINFPVDVEDNSTRGSIKSVECSPEFLNQLLPALPQQRIAHIQSLNINCETYTRPRSVQPLPSCVLKLIPAMENLDSLTFTTVLDTTLRAFIPLLSTVPITRNLSLHVTLISEKQLNDEVFTLANKYTSVYQSYDESFTGGTLTNSEYTCTCSSQETIQQLLQFLPQQHMAQIQTFEVNYFTVKPLPPCLPELISRMERLNTLIIKNALDTSLTEIIPDLSRLPSLRKLRFSHNPKKSSQYESNAYIREMKIKIIFCSNSIESIECQNCTSECIDQILSIHEGKDENSSYARPPTHKTIEICNIHYRELQPLPCFLIKAIPRMEKLNTLTLFNVTSPSELIPLLSRVPTLRNLIIQTNTDKFEMLFPTDTPGTIVSTSEFINLFLPQLPHQTIAKIGRVTCSPMQTSKGDLTLPSHMLELFPKMESLNSLVFNTVLDSTLIALMTMLSIVPVQRELSLEITVDAVENRGTFTYGTLKKVCTCTCTSPEVIEQLLLFLPQQHMVQIQTLEIRFYITKPLPPCLPELIPKIERLKTLTLVNVLETSLMELIPELSGVPTLRNLTLQGYQINSECIAILCKWLPKCQLETFTLLRSTGTRIIHKMKIALCNTYFEAIICHKCTTEFIDQILIQKPQKILTQVKILEIILENPQPLPCLIKLIPRMEVLNTLVLKNVLDTSLIEIMPVLSQVSTLRNLVLQTSTKNFEMQFPTDSLLPPGAIRSKFSDEFLPQLPQQVIDHVASLTISCSQEDTYPPQGDPKPLPPHILELVPKMESLNSLTLETVLDTSLIKLMTILSTVQRDLSLNITVGAHMTEGFTYGTVENTCTCTMSCTSSEIMDKLLRFLPQQYMAKIELFEVSFHMSKIQPLCLLEVISRMENLNTLRLENVPDTAWTELLPELFRVSTLRKLTLNSTMIFRERCHCNNQVSIHKHSADCKVTVILSSNVIEVIECQYSAMELINQILPKIPLQLITQVKSLTIHNEDKYEGVKENGYYYLELDDEFEDECKCACNDDSSYQLLPIPPCLPEMVSRMERLNTLTLMNVLDTSLTELLLALPRVTNLRNLTLPQVNPEGSALLSQWLSTCQLEKLTLPFLLPDHVEMVSKALTAVSSLKTLDIHQSVVAIHSIQAFESMLQQNQSLIDVNISMMNMHFARSDCTCCLARALHQNATLVMRKLDMSWNSIGDEGALAMAEMLKHNCTIEELDLSNAHISSDGAVAMAEALHYNTALRKLVMSLNQIGERGALAMAEMLKCSTTLEELDLSNVKINSGGTVAMAQALHCNTTLRKLDMKGNPVEESGALAMAEMLKHNAGIEELDMCNTQIGSDGAVAIAEALHNNQALKKVVMNMNPLIGERGGLAIAEMLKHNASIEELDMCNAQIGSDGAVAIAEALHHNTILRNLDVSMNPTGVLAMAEMLKHNNTLEELDLRSMLYRDANSKKAIKALVESLAVNQHLKKLSISSQFYRFVRQSLLLYDAHKERVLLVDSSRNDCLSEHT